MTHMLFSSIEFLFLFLPIVLAVYYCLPFRWGLKNGWLLLASLFFYAWGEPSFVFVMLLSIAFNYVMALVIACARERSCLSKLLLAVAVSGNLSVLGVWKYLNFITATVRSLVPAWQPWIPQTSFVLPIGISFFTFQALSYVIDVYRGIPVQRNPLKIALYIALFPQLVAGPIVRYTTIYAEIESRRTTFAMFSDGVYRFLCGFNKKMLLANLLAVVADKAFSLQSLDMPMAWLGAICYTLQIFFDFSGYSDMAIGLGLMFGFHFLENFNYPYISKTVTEFWRRWHISLGTWFRDYLYFPLGGSRVGRWRLIINLSIVWLATGVWHGANWTFVAWGCLYGILIMIEKLWNIPKHIEISLALRVFYQPFTLLMIVFGWVLFRAPDMSCAWRYLCTMIGLVHVETSPVSAAFEFRNVAIPLFAAMVFSVPLVPWLCARFGRSYVCGGGGCLAGISQLALFAVGVSYLVMNAHNPFIYFNF